MTSTEQQIAAALSARAGGITMDTPGKWMYVTGEPGPQGRDPIFALGVEPPRRSDPPAGVGVVMPAETYAPGQPWTQQDRLVAAPSDADGWVDWLDEGEQWLPLMCSVVDSLRFA